MSYSGSSGHCRLYMVENQLNTNQLLGLGQILQVLSFRMIMTTAGRARQDPVRHMVSRPAFLARLGLPYVHDE